MATISVTDFNGFLVNWGNARNTQFSYNWPVKGGWEGWIQVDLVGYILKDNSAYEILREQGIYTSAGKRVDLLLNTDQAYAAQIPVEIKAQSFENRDNFIAGVNEDITKLTNERSLNYQACTCIMLAVPFNQLTLNQLLDIRSPTNHSKRIFKNRFVGEVALVTAVWSGGSWIGV